MGVARGIREMMERSSWIRKMFETGARLKAVHGEQGVCDFSLGNPSAPPPDEFSRVLREIIDTPLSGKHAYMPNIGHAQTREAVAEVVSAEQERSVPAERIVMTCGAGGGLNVVLKSILEPGDEVLAPRPCFMEYAFYAANHGGVLTLVDSHDDFDLDIQAMEAAMGPRTRAVIINSPNNPSGRVYPPDSIQALGELLERKSRETGRTIYLISDEPYRKIVYDGVTVAPVLATVTNSIVVSSYSKQLSIPGERIGWIAVNPAAEGSEELVNGMILANRILGFVNAPALMQRAVARLAGAAVDVEQYRRKRDRLCDAMASMGYRFLRPQGTFYLFPRAPGGDDVAFVEVLQQERILAVPGRGFGLAGYFRIAFCVDDDVIERSLEGFRRAREAVNHTRS